MDACWGTRFYCGRLKTEEAEQLLRLIESEDVGEEEKGDDEEAQKKSKRKENEKKKTKLKRKRR